MRDGDDGGLTEDEKRIAPTGVPAPPRPSYIPPPSVTIRKMPCILARPHRNLFIQQDLQFICTIS